MCIYCGTTKYRQIYKNHNGSIPKDKLGRTYDIHHRDGNKKNNDPANLVAVSLEEHFEIHYKQGDWAACKRLSHRLNLKKEIKSEIARLHSLKQFEDGTHPFIKQWKERLENGSYKKWGKLNAEKRLKDGTHNFLVNREEQNRKIRSLVDQGLHYWQSKQHKDEVSVRSSNRMRALAKDGKHPGFKINTCPYCGFSKKGPSIYKEHFDKCKSKPE